jgi:hypothetical protein
LGEGKPVDKRPLAAAATPVALATFPALAASTFPALASATALASPPAALRLLLLLTRLLVLLLLLLARLLLGTRHSKKPASSCTTAGTAVAPSPALSPALSSASPRGLLADRDPIPSLDPKAGHALEPHLAHRFGLQGWGFGQLAAGRHPVVGS